MGCRINNKVTAAQLPAPFFIYNPTAAHTNANFRASDPNGVAILCDR